MIKGQIILYTIINVLLGSSALAATPPKLKAGQLKGQFFTEYYMTNANYNASGSSFEKLPNENEYSNIKARPSILYGLTNEWAVSSGITYAYGQSINSAFQRTSSSITDLDASLYYKLKRKKLYILPQIYLSVPFLSIDPNQDNAIINEGALKIELGSWFEKKLIGHRFYLYAGYAYQGDGRAHLIPWQAGSNGSFGRLIYGAEANGNEIAINDQLISTPEFRTNRTDQLNAGSKKYYAINPKVINLKTWLGARVGKNTIAYIKYEKSISGSSSAAGQSIIVEFKWRILNPYSFKGIEQKSNFRLDGLKRNL